MLSVLSYACMPYQCEQSQVGSQEVAEVCPLCWLCRRSTNIHRTVPQEAAWKDGKLSYHTLHQGIPTCVPLPTPVRLNAMPHQSSHDSVTLIWKQDLGRSASTMDRHTCSSASRQVRHTHRVQSLIHTLFSSASIAGHEKHVLIRYDGCPSSSPPQELSFSQLKIPPL